MPHKQFQSGIDACNQCATVCDQCVVLCLADSQVQTMTRCIELGIDCAQICRFAAALMARGSAHAQKACELCARLCNACGDECAKHPVAHCQDCAESCRLCAEECQRMATEMPGSRVKAQTRIIAH